MARGKNLSELEKKKLLSFTTKEMSMREMGRRIGRSDAVVRHFLKKMESYGIKKSGGPKSKMSNRLKHRVITYALNTRKTAAQITSDWGLKVSRWTVARLLRQSKLMKKENIPTAPKLLVKHKAERVEFGTCNLSRDWNKVIFSDIKKFKLDGPDGYAMYWRDLREDPCYFSEINDGESLAVWAAFCANGLFELGFTSNYTDPEQYTDMLQQNLLPYLSNHSNADWIFQCNNSAVHGTYHYQKWIEREKVQVRLFPCGSADINPIESLWGYIVFDVYTGVKQYSNMSELKAAIIKSWQSIPIAVIEDLVAGMPDRMQELIDKNGEYTSY